MKMIVKSNILSIQRHGVIRMKLGVDPFIDLMSWSTLCVLSCATNNIHLSWINIKWFLRDGIEIINTGSLR